MRAAEVTLAERAGRAGGGARRRPDDALPLVERVVDEAIAALCAEAVGAMAAMHELTVEYLKTRKQFGVPIGSFQVLQHRAVDMLDRARAGALHGDVRHHDGAGATNAAERRKAISAAKVQIGRSGRFVGQQAIQLHGGIGMTMEYKVGHYFKRAHHDRHAVRRRRPSPRACGGGRGVGVRCAPSRARAGVFLQEQAPHVVEHELRVEEIEAVDVAHLAGAVDQEGAEDVVQRPAGRRRVGFRVDRLVIGGEHRRQRGAVGRGEEQPFRGGGGAERNCAA